MENNEMFEKNAYEILELSNDFIKELTEKAFPKKEEGSQVPIENFSKDKDYDIENAAKKKMIEKMQFLRMNLPNISVDELRERVNELVSFVYAYNAISTEEKRLVYGFGDNVINAVKEYINRISSQLKLHGKTAFDINTRLTSEATVIKQNSDMDERIKNNLYQYCQNIIPKIIPDEEVSFRELSSKMDYLSLDTLIDSVRMLVEQVWAYEKIDTKENRDRYKVELAKQREQADKNLDR